MWTADAKASIVHNPTFFWSNTMKNLVFILLSTFILIACQQEDNNQKRREELRKSDILKQPYKRKE